VDLTIRDERWTIEQAAQVCEWYEHKFAETLTYYDFGGTDTDPYAHDTVDLSDGGRLVIINARLDAGDIPTMISRAQDAPWDAVPAQADLMTAPDLEGLLDGADALYQHFRKDHGLGPTRTHKLLHLKRPRVFPVVDGVVRAVYLDKARAAAKARGAQYPLYWATLAVEMQANANAFFALVERLGDARSARLTSPRLHDLLVWSLHNPRDGGGRARAEAAA
jgi:hypothetical protein